MQKANAVLPVEMGTWIEEVTESSIVTAARQAGGGRNEAWIIELQRADAAPEQIFLRWDRSDPAATGDPWTLRREAEVYRALSTTALPVAKFIAVHPTAQAMLLSIVHGDGRYSSIRDPDQATLIAKDFIGRLAQLHQLDVADLGLATRPGATMKDHVTAQLDEMDALIAFRGGVPEAELGLALAWLRNNIPRFDGRAVLVQGDTGPGNFMFDGDHVSAIVDWELAHIGDPMDDLAWVSLRSVQEPFPDLEERFAEYERASGNAVDLHRIRYYRLLAESKIMVMGHGIRTDQRSAGPDGGGDVGARLIFGQLHRRLLVETLCEAMGVATEPTATPELGNPDETDKSEWHALYGAVLDQLRAVIVPRITDGFAQQRTKGLARVVKYLEAIDLKGRAYADEELADLESVFGTRPASPSQGRRQLALAVRDASIEPRVALAVIHRRVRRDNDLLRESSGVLADRHYDPLRRFAQGASTD